MPTVSFPAIPPLSLSLLRVYVCVGEWAWLIYGHVPNWIAVYLAGATYTKAGRAMATIF